MKFWIRIVTERNPILIQAYEKLSSVKGAKWCSNIKKRLETLGFGNVWINQGTMRPKIFMANFLKRIQDCHIQDYDLTSRNTSRLSVLNSLGINPVIISTYLKIPMSSHLLRELAQF